MKISKDKFIAIFATCLVGACSFVPYIQTFCNKNGCFPSSTGYGFVGNLPHQAQINVGMLVVEILVILTIFGGYYFLILKKND